MGDKAKKATRSDRKNKAGKKAKRAIPKRIGGLRLPKELREKGAKLIAAARSPAGREAIAAGIAIAATAAEAAITRKHRDKADAKPADGGQGAGPGEGGTTRSPDAQAIVAAMGSVAETFLRALAKKG